MSELVILQFDDLRAELSALLDQKLGAIVSAIQTQNSTKKETKYLTPGEAAERLGISKVTLWKWTKAGLIQGHRINSQVRYKPADMEEALKKIKGIEKSV